MTKYRVVSTRLVDADPGDVIEIADEHLARFLVDANHVEPIPEKPTKRASKKAAPTSSKKAAPTSSKKVET